LRGDIGAGRGAALGASSTIIALAIATGVLKAVLIMVTTYILYTNRRG
jgi:hypothetical protein